MASRNTLDFRAAISHQSTAWLARCLADWRRNGTASLGGFVMRARIIAMVRAELNRRTLGAPFRDVATMTEYGMTQKLTNSIRVF